MVDLEVDIVRFIHDVDSNDMPLTIAGSLAFKERWRKPNVPAEPTMEVDDARPPLITRAMSSAT